MKAFLIDNTGFKKMINVDERKPMIDMVRAPNINFTNSNPSDLVMIKLITFYYERSFYNEDNEQVLIYKEKL